MRVPFFYGWIIVAVAFVTMGVGVNARTAFSLLFPPILDEFGAFSFGFLVSAVLSLGVSNALSSRVPPANLCPWPAAARASRSARPSSSTLVGSPRQRGPREVENSGGARSGAGRP